MRKILKFLSADGSFLYEDCGFRIVNSDYCPEFGGTGGVFLSNGVVELCFWLERDRLFMDLRAAGRETWCSFDIAKQMLTGDIVDQALMDTENVAFLKSHLSELQDRFSKENAAQTEVACRELTQQRSKRLFG